MMYFIQKLCIQNNLPNMKINVIYIYIYIYSNLGFEYRIKKMKSSTPLFETSFENNLLMFPSNENRTFMLY